jgi:hypothetical protein
MMDGAAQIPLTPHGKAEKTNIGFTAFLEWKSKAG